MRITSSNLGMGGAGRRKETRGTEGKGRIQLITTQYYRSVKQPIKRLTERCVTGPPQNLRTAARVSFFCYYIDENFEKLKVQVNGPSSKRGGEQTRVTRRKPRGEKFGNQHQILEVTDGLLSLIWFDPPPPSAYL